MTPEEQARRDRAIAKQKAGKDEEKQILAAARNRARTEDSYRKVLVGAAVLDEAEKHPAYRDALIKLLTRFFTTERQRQALEVLGVPPLASPASSPPETHPDSDAADFPAVAAQAAGNGVRMVRH